MNRGSMTDVRTPDVGTNRPAHPHSQALVFRLLSDAEGRAWSDGYSCGSSRA